MVLSAHAQRCRYLYDALDRLTTSAPADQPDVRRFYQESRLATEVEGTLKRSIFQYDDLLLAQTQVESADTTVHILATDQHRSVLQALSDSGAEPLAYTPYGHHPTEVCTASLMGFNGERRDLVTGHYLLGNGYRAFNPALMRFNSPDSLSPFGKGGVNGYAYCEQDPVNKVDPSGHVAGWALIKSMLGKIIARRGIQLEKTINRLNDIDASLNRVISGGKKARSLPDLTTFSDEFNQPKSFIGFHGSTQESGTFLKQGLDPSRMNSSAGLSGGRGFYLSLTPHIAIDFAHIALVNFPSSAPEIFGVYMSHYPARVSGVAYRYGLLGAGGLKPRNLREMEVVIQERFYKTVSIRDIRGGEAVVLPQASEASF
ncbi:RHS repeat-associated core domain-containing protein [Pseudomonas alliivorans]|nr:RHS repeat-associated core domain-containing protein [Pseudomonas alliivorans]